MTIHTFTGYTCPLCGEFVPGPFVQHACPKLKLAYTPPPTPAGVPDAFARLDKRIQELEARITELERQSAYSRSERAE